LKYLVGTGVSRSAYHTDGNWRDGYFKSAARDQKFIFEEKKLVEEWGVRDNKGRIGHLAYFA
jgi:hypothetical protein